MKQRQRGMTFLGIVTILVILGVAFYAGLRLIPVYLEYSKVARVLEQVRDEHVAMDSPTTQLIRNSLERRWDVEDIKSLGWKEVEIEQKSDGFEVRAAYDVEERFIANVYLVTKFDKTIVIPR
jgi:hypothetical protein